MRGRGRRGGGELGRDMKWDAYIPTCIVCSLRVVFYILSVLGDGLFVFWRIVIMVKVAQFVLVDPL